MKYIIKYTVTIANEGTEKLIVSQCSRSIQITYTFINLST